MTRINLIPVTELVRQHLIAEYRELPRIFGLVEKTKGKVVIPPQYVLGTGHCKFFYNKLTWLADRHQLLIDEMHRRGYNTNFESLRISYSHIDSKWWNDWTPNEIEIGISRSRIEERLKGMKHGSV